MNPLRFGERAEIYRAFTGAVARRRVFDAYWVESHRMVCMRTVAGRRRLLPPAGGVHFGRYDAATEWHTFLADLFSTMEAPAPAVGVEAHRVAAA